MDYAIEIRNVTKKFKEATALKQVTLSVESGRIYGIIGRNGSGKTVLFKCICGLMAVTEGEITVLGQSVGDGLHVPKGVGAVIETPGFLPNVSGFRNLYYLSSLSGKPNRKKIRDAITLVGLDPDSRKNVGNYSLGMRQRLGLAQALMEDPELLLLDEPMNGLDNHGVKQMRNLLKELRSQGKTIILASHNQTDIVELCDQVYEMDAGVLSVSHAAKYEDGASILHLTKADIEEGGKLWEVYSNLVFDEAAKKRIKEKVMSHVTTVSAHKENN